MKKIAIVAAAGLALGLAACSEPPTSGTIYKMPYAGESYWYSTHCGMFTTVTRTRSVTRYDSKGRAAGFSTQTYTESVCVMWVQDRHVNPPSWSICLRDDADSKHTGCIDVPRGTYERYQVGGHYPDPR